MCTNCTASGTHFVFVRIFVLDILFLFTCCTLIVLCILFCDLTTVSLSGAGCLGCPGAFFRHGDDASKF